MKNAYAIFFVALLSVALVDIGHAAIIQYEISGTVDLADTNWNSITSHEMSGHMYISDSNSAPYQYAVDFEIVSFVIRAGGYEWGGVGRIWGSNDRNLYLDGPGDWEVSTGLVPLQYGWDWESQYQLPAAMWWPGDAWHYGDEIFSRVGNFNLLAVPAIPVPAAVWLFCSGLVGLIGFAKRSIS